LPSLHAISATVAGGGWYVDVDANRYHVSMLSRSTVAEIVGPTSKLIVHPQMRLAGLVMPCRVTRTPIPH
jgi:hypothetical protein